MRFLEIISLGTLAAIGCGAVQLDVGGAANDQGVPAITDGGAPLRPGDMLSPPAFGKYATELALNVTLGADGGAQSAGFKLFLLWSSGPEDDHGNADSVWLPCDIPLPNLADVPLQALDSATSAQLQVVHNADGTTRIAVTNLSIVAGAALADPVNDPLPTDPNKVCTNNVITGCLTPDPDTGLPGAAVQASGLTPDVDLITLDLRLELSLSGALKWDGSLDGTVSAASLESHVLTCHLRAGGNCNAADVARLNAAGPRFQFTSGTFRSRNQGTYFTCPVFLGDPEGALADTSPVDAGEPDMFIAHPTFTNAIEDDLDARGCATGGCHETFDKPGQMHLAYKPATPDALMKNYQAVMPWTTGPPPGGRLVNQVPLPEEMKARWLQWIAAGMPY